MKFTLKWLKDHLDTKKSEQQIIDTLNNIGLEVENCLLYTSPSPRDRG